MTTETHTVLTQYNIKTNNTQYNSDLNQQNTPNESTTGQKIQTT